jgi:hypothetical protein
MKEIFGAWEVGCEVVAIVGKSSDSDRRGGLSSSSSCPSLNLKTSMDKGRRLRVIPDITLSEAEGDK